MVHATCRFVEGCNWTTRYSLLFFARVSNHLVIAPSARIVPISSTLTLDMEKVDKAVESIVALVGTWNHVVAQENRETVYYDERTVLFLKSRARAALALRSDIPERIKEDLTTFDTGHIDDVIRMYAYPVGHLTPTQAAEASIGRDDLTHNIMADYIVMAYDNYMASKAGAVTVASCTQDIIDMLQVCAQNPQTTLYSRTAPAKHIERVAQPMSVRLQGLRMAITPASSGLWTKDRVASYLALRSRGKGGVISDIKYRALEILATVPDLHFEQEAVATKTRRDNTAATGYGVNLR